MNNDTTIDPREVAFYTELADAWWDRAGPFWPLHRLNELRVQYIRQRLCEHFERDPESMYPLQGLRVLDVGCGGGILSESMAKLGATVTGIDVVEKNIGIATVHASNQGLVIDYRLSPASTLADAGEHYDVVLNMEVVEHVADLDAFMTDCCRLVADNGVMFVATINRTLFSWLFAIVGAEYILRWLPRGTHRWDWFRTPEEITERLNKGGLHVQDATGVKVNPLTRRLKITRWQAVNYMLLATRRSQVRAPIADCSSGLD